MDWNGRSRPYHRLLLQCTLAVCLIFIYKCLQFTFPRTVMLSTCCVGSCSPLLLTCPYHCSLLSYKSCARASWPVLITYHCGDLLPFVPCYSHSVSAGCCNSSFCINDCSQILLCFNLPKFGSLSSPSLTSCSSCMYVVVDTRSTSDQYLQYSLIHHGESPCGVSPGC